MPSKMLYKIKPKNHNEKDLRKIISDHPEIKFVSLMGIDLNGNGTEEKIPIKVFEKKGVGLSHLQCVSPMKTQVFSSQSYDLTV